MAPEELEVRISRIETKLDKILQLNEKLVEKLIPQNNSKKEEESVSPIISNEKSRPLVPPEVEVVEDNLDTTRGKCVKYSTESYSTTKPSLLFNTTPPNRIVSLKKPKTTKASTSGVWIEPRTPEPRNKFKFSKSTENQNPKRLRQLKITGMKKVRDVPVPTVELSTLEEFGGGTGKRSNSGAATSINIPSSSATIFSVVENSFSKRTSLDKFDVSKDLFEEDLMEIDNLPTEVVNIPPPPVAVKPIDEDETMFFPSSPCTPPRSGTSRKSLFSPPRTPPRPSGSGSGGSSRKLLFPRTPDRMTSPLKVNNGQPPSKFPSPVRKKKIDPNCTAELIANFDVIPTRPIDVSTTFKTVRKKADRARLDGWDCDMCRDYYESLESQISPAELQRLKNKCSRHRSERPMNVYHSPKDAWNASMPNTEECIRMGYIEFGVASPPVRRKRHDMLD